MSFWTDRIHIYVSYCTKVCVDGAGQAVEVYSVQKCNDLQLQVSQGWSSVIGTQTNIFEKKKKLTGCLKETLGQSSQGQKTNVVSEKLICKNWKRICCC